MDKNSTLENLIADVERERQSTASEVPEQLEMIIRDTRTKIRAAFSADKKIAAKLKKTENA